jgi:hypothetical protein
MKTMLDRVRAAGIFEEIGEPTASKPSRYAIDPDFRERKKAATRAWNAAHPTEKRTNDQRWAMKNQNAAQANRRYRARKKENTCNRPT